MKLFISFVSIFIALISILYSTPLIQLVKSLTSSLTNSFTSSKILSQIPAIPLSTTTLDSSMSVASAVKKTMSKLPNAKIVPRRSSARGHSDHGWLNTYHTFSFADYYAPKFQNFGSLRVLNEDRVASGSGFPTHPHRDAEIFSYILNGELTHRDSMIKKGAEGEQGDDFYRMKRGDVQFTTGGTGIAHSEGNEGTEEVHFLQIWALPWTRGLTPRYHTRTFDEAEKRKAFVPILSPLAAGPGASAEAEKTAEPALPETIPVHADLLMNAAIIPVDSRFKYVVGGDIGDGKSAVRNLTERKVYIHVPMVKNGAAKIRLDGREEAVLGEGDGAFVSNVKAGDVLSFESIGEAEAEVVVLDSN